MLIGFIKEIEDYHIFSNLYFLCLYIVWSSFSNYSEHWLYSEIRKLMKRSSLVYLIRKFSG